MPIQQSQSFFLSVCFSVCLSPCLSVCPQNLCFCLFVILSLSQPFFFCGSANLIYQSFANMSIRRQMSQRWFTHFIFFRSLLFSVLRTFIYDPLVEWQRTKGRELVAETSKTGEVTNEEVRCSVDGIWRARKAIRKTTTYLFWKAGLLICCKGNTNENNCKVSCLETPSFWRYRENYVTRNKPEKFRNFRETGPWTQKVIACKPFPRIQGPVLFNIFSNDLWQSVKHST